MNYKSVVVYVDDAKRSQRALNTAAEIAARFDAHLTATFIYEPLYYRYPLAYEGGVIPDFTDDTKLANEEAAAVQAEFEKACRAYGVDKCDWRYEEGELLSTLSLQARYADLVVVTQASPDVEEGDLNTDPDLPAKLAIASGRPVLVAPYAGQHTTIGKRVMVAWNASREATRAVSDALPLMDGTEQVNILAINPETGDYRGHGEEPGADIALYLSRHGINVEATQTVSGASSIADTLLSRAADLGSDLICMGAYGHSRLRELTLGGVTRKLLREMTVPVLLSH